MKYQKVTVSIFVALLLILGASAAVWHNSPALAKSNAKAPSINAKEAMSKFAPPRKNDKAKTSEPTVRKSRLPQLNVVSEAAVVLNVLPINIIEEMNKGKTLVQIAKEKGITKAEFLQKLKDNENQLLDEEVKAGTISEDHADAIKEGQKDRLTKSLSLKSVNVNDHQSMDMGN
ncbi:hypothetical protein [Neobacillus drentensis]|uniref:hypothetical protein n=1 Tax=Neobacillus drentensis TaxID=220684 RepID=UPI002FFFEA38